MIHCYATERGRQRLQSLGPKFKLHFPQETKNATSDALFAHADSIPSLYSAITRAGRFFRLFHSAGKLLDVLQLDRATACSKGLD